MIALPEAMRRGFRRFGLLLIIVGQGLLTWAGTGRRIVRATFVEALESRGTKPVAAVASRRHSARARARVARTRFLTSGDTWVAISPNTREAGRLAARHHSVGLRSERG